MMKLLRNEFFIALLLLLGYLSTNGYVYGWDDQHLEIPILKHLIDPSLYKGDYYVESATKYFTCWLYPLLAKFITVGQIPAVYLALFLISRYTMFYWVYKMWSLVSGSSLAAVCATITFIILGRTDEFLYSSFCHEEFSFIFMFAGFYFFYKEWYLAAALLFGLGVNFHAIYNLFPMLYLSAYLLFCHPQRFKMVFQTGVVFIIASMPFLLWQIPISISREMLHPVDPQEWIPMYLMSCYQNFLFAGTSLQDVLHNIHAWWNCTSKYLFLIALYLFHLAFNPQFRSDKKIHSIMAVSCALLGVVFVFDYIHPSRFVLDLNLVRVEQFMRFFMMGYTTIWAWGQLSNKNPWLALSAAVMVVACGTSNILGLFFISILSIILIVDAMSQYQEKSFKRIFSLVSIIILGIFVYSLLTELQSNPKMVMHFWHRFLYVILAMGVVFGGVLFKKNNLWLRRLLIIVPLLGTFCICVQNYCEFVWLNNNGPSGYELLRDWRDMQFYVKDHTPKDALILTPYDMNMGGFRIHSERKVLVCFRDCGIIGFDYAAAVEWRNRINDVKNFKILTPARVDDDVLRAILKYNVDYVVFMRYYGPDGDTPVLKKMYENTAFSLYQVV